MDFIKLSSDIARGLLNDCFCIDVPVVAVIVNYKSGDYHSFCNKVYADNDPTAHAEVLAIRDMCVRCGVTYLDDYDLYVNLEPCPMCASLISFARIRRLYFGAYDPKSGGVDHGPRIFQSSSIHYEPEVIGGIHEKECAEVITAFFKRIRALKED